MEAKNVLLFVVIVVLIYIVYGFISKDVSTLSGLTSAQTMQTINPSSLAASSSSGNTSNFTYSMWMYIDDWNYRYGNVKTIFTRTDSKNVHPCPAVQLDAIENNLTVTLACFPGTPAVGGAAATIVDHTCTVGNIPIQRWVNLIVSVYGRSMDIYIDGKLVKTCLLPGVANVNSQANIYVTPSGGFDGWTSKFQYFPSPLNPQEAWNIYTAGYASPYANMFGSYQVQVSLVENGNAKSTVTI